MDNEDYIKKPYFKSSYVFKRASVKIEEAMLKFQDVIKLEQPQINPRSKPNCNITHSK